MSVFIPLHELLPKLAEDETRSLIFTNKPFFLKNFIKKEKLLSQKYKRYEFHESFCSDPDCDCRKAMINVFNQEGERVTTLSYLVHP